MLQRRLCPQHDSLIPNNEGQRELLHGCTPTVNHAEYKTQKLFSFAPTRLPLAKACKLNATMNDAERALSRQRDYILAAAVAATLKTKAIMCNSLNHNV